MIEGVLVDNIVFKGSIQESDVEDSCPEDVSQSFFTGKATSLYLNPKDVSAYCQVGKNFQLDLFDEPSPSDSPLENPMVKLDFREDSPCGKRILFAPYDSIRREFFYYK